MAKFAVQGLVAEKIYNGMGTSPEKCGTGLNTGVRTGLTTSKFRIGARTDPERNPWVAGWICPANQAGPQPG